MERAKISVAMTTYNGSKYIVQLLDSLRLQEVKPDEVLIADDCSRDNTVEIVKNYIKKYDLTGWNIYRNKKNIGWQKNFKEVISKTTGDYIFLADQDDLWHSDKIKRFLNCFEATKAWLIVSDFEIVGDGKSRKTVAMPNIDYIKENENKKVIVTKSYSSVLRPGCVMAFSAKLKEIYLELWMENQPHDALLWSIASITGNTYYLDFKSIDFRRTDDNASGSIAHDVRFKKASIIREKVIIDWYLNSNWVNKENIEHVKQNYQWSSYRYELLINNKFFYWFKLFKFRNCYMSFKQYLGDLYYFFKS